MIKYKLTELAPITDNSIVKVIGDNYHLVMTGVGTTEITWNELMNKARMNFKNRYGTCLIIIEEPLGGTVYSFGNYDKKYVYEQGNTKGYA